MEAYWNYEDVGTFFFVIVLLNALVHLGVRIRLLHSTELVHPSVGIQGSIILFLGIALYTILKLRYRRPVIAPLGWRIPNRFYSAVAILGGVIAALGVTYATHSRGDAMPTIPAKEFLLGLSLGPILEETVFRGYLFPVLDRTLGTAISVIATAVLFAAFHGPTDMTHWMWFTATGLGYGSLRVASGTTTAAAVMHAICNLTLFLCAKS